MDHSSEDEKARHPAGFDKIRFFADLNQREGDLMRLVRRISRVSNVSEKQLDQFIAEAKRIHEMFSVMWIKLQEHPEVYAPTLDEPTAKVETLLRNVENRLNILYQKMHDGRSFDFPPFPDIRQAQQMKSKRNSPLPRGTQDPETPSTGHAEGKGHGKRIGQ